MMISTYILMHILKVKLFYLSMDDVPTRFRNFFDNKITICYIGTLFFLRLFFSKPPYWIPASTKLNSGNGFEKSTPKNSRIPILRWNAHDLIIFYKVGNSKENHGLLGVNELTECWKHFINDLIRFINSIILRLLRTRSARPFAVRRWRWTNFFVVRPSRPVNRGAQGVTSREAHSTGGFKFALLVAT